MNRTCVESGKNVNGSKARTVEGHIVNGAIKIGN